LGQSSSLFNYRGPRLASNSVQDFGLSEPISLLSLSLSLSPQQAVSSCRRRMNRYTFSHFPLIKHWYSQNHSVLSEIELLWLILIPFLIGLLFSFSAFLCIQNFCLCVFLCSRWFGKPLFLYCCDATRCVLNLFFFFFFIIVGVTSSDLVSEVEYLKLPSFYFFIFIVFLVCVI